MKTKIMSIISNVVFGLAMIVGLGCASNRINLVDNGTVTVERINSQGAYVSSVYVYQDGDYLVISGRVKQLYSTVVTDRGHVDITMLNPYGTTLKQVSKRYNPRLSRKKRTAYFRARLPVILTPGVIVRVMHHSGSNLC